MPEFAVGLTRRIPRSPTAFRQMSENVVRRMGSSFLFLKIRPSEPEGHRLKCSLKSTLSMVSPRTSEIRIPVPGARCWCSNHCGAD